MLRCCSVPGGGLVDVDVETHTLDTSTHSHNTRAHFSHWSDTSLELSTEDALYRYVKRRRERACAALVPGQPEIFLLPGERGGAAPGAHGRACQILLATS